jgi:hypothetical protein
MRTFVFTVLFMFVAGLAFAADVDGTWKGSMDMMGQSMELGFTFKANGSELTGTHKGPQGNEYPISEGKIENDKITFAVQVTGQMAMKINYEGKIAGDEITLTFKMDGGMGGPPGGGGPGGGMGEMPPIVLKKVE